MKYIITTIKLVGEHFVKSIVKYETYVVFCKKIQKLFKLQETLYLKDIENITKTYIILIFFFKKIIFIR